MAPLDTLARADEAADPFDVAALNRRAAALPTHDLIAFALDELFPGRIAVVSSFGAESAVLLHHVAEVDRAAPVIFLDTGRLFAETLEHRSRLVAHLGLTDVRTITPALDRLRSEDAHRALWMTDPDRCCAIRKTEPLERALVGFDAWFTGRKRFQGGSRARLPLFEDDRGRIKVNPLAGWRPDALKAYAVRHALPAHPLVAQGYPSIGCVPCTSRVRPGEDRRAGRWRGTGKTECGIHLGEADGSGI